MKLICDSIVINGKRPDDRHCDFSFAMQMYTDC